MSNIKEINCDTRENYTVMNVIYKPMAKDDIGKWLDDYAMIIYKDNNTGIKNFYIEQKPMYTFYLAKPDCNTNYHSMNKDELEPITCPYREITKTIAKRVGMYDKYKENIQSGNSKMNMVFFTHPRVYGADMMIKNYIRMKFSEKYQNPVIPISILFFDIESDSRNNFDVGYI